APSPCTLSGVVVDSDDVDGAPNAPLVPAVDLKSVAIGEPYGDGSAKLTFTVRVGAGAAPANSQWYVIWNRTTPDAQFDRNYVAMRTDLLGAVRFEYGRVNYPITPTSPATNQGNLPTRLGDATGSWDPATGTIRIVVANANVDGVGAGQTLVGVEGRSFLGRNDALPISQSVSSDFTPPGNYTLVGNPAS